MSRFAKIVAALGLALASTPSFGQATRTWVSGVGDDVNPCSRTAPCKTFAGAISKTQAGGEINCLDPGGFGAITISKSITIDCTGTMGSILNSGTNGVIVNDSLTANPNTIEVILRGLSIDGAGSIAGLNGIRFLRGRSLVIQDVFVQNEDGGNGIALEPAGASSFFAENVTVTGGQRGLFIQPTGSAGSVKAILRNFRSQNNSNAGLRISPTSTSSAGVSVVVDRSSFTGNATGISLQALPGTSNTALLINDSVFANNANGIAATGGLARIRIGNSTISGNTVGVQISSGAIVNTYGTNHLDGNATDGAFTSPVIPSQ